MDASRIPNPPIRVLIADDQPVFTRMLEAVLRGDERIAVVGHAVNGEEAVELATMLAPDVVLMDISMPIMDGLEATRRLRQLDSAARVLMLTESDLPADVLRAEAAGADAYVPKKRIVAALRDAIVAAASV